MANHVKPTKEELEANIKKAQDDIAALDEAEKTDPPKKDETEEEDEEETISSTKTTEEEETETDGDEEDENGDDGEGEEDDSTKTSKTKESDESETDTSVDGEGKKEVDWKKRYADSTRQEQISRLKEQKLSDAYDKADQLPEPTEEDLTQEFPDWENLSEFEKKLARKTLHNDRRLAYIQEARTEIKQVEAWRGKVKDFITDPATLVNNPDLEGKTEAFTNYAMQRKVIGNDLTELVNSFLYLASKAVVKHKGKMFETGTGGSNERRQPKSQKLTVEEGAVLRETDSKKFREFLLAGKIASE